MRAGTPTIRKASETLKIVWHIALDQMHTLKHAAVFAPKGRHVWEKCTIRPSHKSPAVQQYDCIMHLNEPTGAGLTRISNDGRLEPVRVVAPVAYSSNMPADIATRVTFTPVGQRYRRLIAAGEEAWNRRGRWREALKMV
jgi:hypothetical protein